MSNVAIIGDAVSPTPFTENITVQIADPRPGFVQAHAMEPHFASGASQAIEVHLLRAAVLLSVDSQF